MVTRVSDHKIWCKKQSFVTSVKIKFQVVTGITASFRCMTQITFLAVVVFTLENYQSYLLADRLLICAVLLVL